MPEIESKITSRWDECYQKQSLAIAPSDVEPRMIEISYEDDSGEVVHEVIYEDPVKEVTEPRLLVPLRAILALKHLCERDFERFNAVSSVLNDCRIAYYKELQYLREQLQAATQMGSTSSPVCDDDVKNYEVYWFNPPSYVDEELKDFLQTCIRWTHKQLIEELYELRMRLEGKQIEDRPGDDGKSISNLIQKLGPGKLVKRIGAWVSSENGAPKLVEDFEATILELARKIDPESEEDKEPRVQKQQVVQQKASVAPDKGMLEELELLRKKARDAEELMKRFFALQQKYDEAMSTMEAERAQHAAELERMVAKEKAQADQLKSQLATAGRMQATIKPDPGANHLQTLLPQLAKRIAAMSAELLPSTSTSVAAGAGADAGQSRDTSGGAAQLEHEISVLESALSNFKASKGYLEKELREKLRQAKEEAAKARAAAKKLEAELAAAGKEVSPSLPEPEEPVVDDKLEAEVRALRAEVAALRAKLMSAEDAVTKAAAHVEEMQKTIVGKNQKIYRLKEEIKRLKRLTGEPSDDDDEWSGDEADGDDSAPDWLKAYWRRVQKSTKPRWMLLSEDASCVEMRRKCSMAIPSGNQAEALAAFDFLRRKSVQLPQDAGCYPTVGHPLDVKQMRRISADGAVAGEPSASRVSVHGLPHHEPSSASKPPETVIGYTVAGGGRGDPSVCPLNVRSLFQKHLQEQPTASNAYEIAVNHGVAGDNRGELKPVHSNVTRTSFRGGPPPCAGQTSEFIMRSVREEQNVMKASCRGGSPLCASQTPDMGIRSVSGEQNPMKASCRGGSPARAGQVIETGIGSIRGEALLKNKESLQDLAFAHKPSATVVGSGVKYGSAREPSPGPRNAGPDPQNAGNITLQDLCSPNKPCNIAEGLVARALQWEDSACSLNISTTSRGESLVSLVSAQQAPMRESPSARTMSEMVAGSSGRGREEPPPSPLTAKTASLQTPPSVTRKDGSSPTTACQKPSVSNDGKGGPCRSSTVTLQFPEESSPLGTASPEQRTARRSPSRRPLLGDNEPTVRQHQALDVASPVPTVSTLGLSPSDPFSGFTVGELVGMNSLAESNTSTAELSTSLFAGPSVATSVGGAGDVQQWEHHDEGVAPEQHRQRQKPGSATQDTRLSRNARSSSRGGLQGQTSPNLNRAQDLWQARPATAGGQTPLRHEAPALGARTLGEQRCRSAGHLRPKAQQLLSQGNTRSAGAKQGCTGREALGGASPGKATEAAVRILDMSIGSRASPARSSIRDDSPSKGIVLPGVAAAIVQPGVSPAMPPGRVLKAARDLSWLSTS